MSGTNGSKSNGRQPVIVVEGLDKTFQIGDQWVHALDGVSVKVPAGQFLAIMGPSGSGKSTLLYLLGGLDRPSAGRVMVAGRRLDNMNGDDLAQFRRETVGFIFQAFHLIPTMTALQNVALPGVFAAVPREQREQRAAWLLGLLGMTPRMHHKPSQLSGGQQQRVAIARALFNNPPVIMADEPTGALDSKTGQAVMSLLRRLCSKLGKTVIVVTHDAAIARYADRMLLLKDGRVIDDRAPTQEEKRDVA
ncbi:ABC transporter ATP-binding protein [Aggregatilinea lenta]|uniref:ABC transporter ATP-binding protein n=1 Tax=Aggregatilinea lenta TaxID=913108 RepID=UPI000E5B80EC|nr:ABC transporter ATP-binding protein [Aggregatilinea lenta]